MATLLQEPPAKHASVQMDYFDPDTTVITAIKRALANGQDIVFRLQEGDEELLVLGSRGEYFSSLGDEARFFTAPLEQMSMTLLSPGDSRVQQPPQGGRDTEELLWKAAFHASGGLLMRGCLPLDRVELLGWPNLTRLPHSEHSARIAALLSTHPTSIAFASRLLHIPSSEVYRFYSAACCAGLARAVDRKMDEPQLQPHRSRGVLSLLWHKLATH